MAGESIAGIIRRITERLSFYEGFQLAWLKKHWLEIVGKAMEEHSQPSSLEHRILNVKVDNSVWNQAMFIEKKKIIQRINQTFIREIVEDIRLTAGVIKKKDNAEEKETTKSISGRVNTN